MRSHHSSQPWVCSAFRQGLELWLRSFIFHYLLSLVSAWTSPTHHHQTRQATSLHSPDWELTTPTTPVPASSHTQLLSLTSQFYWISLSFLSSAAQTLAAIFDMEILMRLPVYVNCGNLTFIPIKLCLVEWRVGSITPPVCGGGGGGGVSYILLLSLGAH